MIELNNVSKSFDGGISYAVRNISFFLQPNEILALLGASGSGKSTLFRMIRGLLSATSGEILLNQKKISSLSPEELMKTFGCVFQEIGLFPHLTVERNLSIIQNAKVSELLELVGLSPEIYKKRYPHQLSGGEKQRVGVARALANHSKCLLMDEPFAALDAISRSRLQEELLAIKAKTNVSILFITHDIFEAVYLADRIAIVNNGVLEQIGSKEEVFSSPQTPFVKHLIEQVTVILNRAMPKM